ncbi:MAG TPA: potassium/proton antiporter [Oligoflexus sp.]|uniref:potassium/proton antiporter n=1 Tax=Oligoflexus sp. TaxID=1971216 RepID=UPI002D800A2D|nr:potassium/proton antiporter [Oligoflexus sp.]HET9239306.1 potassium/proton antiporter [Oligoflexus sp.]
MPQFQFRNYTLEEILLASSLLLIFSVLASRISSKFGVPALLLFLGIGMLAGSEGPGGIAFDDYRLAFAVGSVCLAVIIFDGGMRTSWKSIQPFLPLGISLSFVGTVVTGAVTGIFAHYVLGLSWLEGLLLGAIVSSTDAAAVFSILRARSLTLSGSLKQTLEFEAGSNDPVAVFLTIGMLMLITTPEQGFVPILTLFLKQAGLGLALGWLGARFIRWLINHIGVEYEGLYGVFLVGLVICLFALTSTLGGSGFLAVYVAGLSLGHFDFLHKGSMTRFVDGIAWLSQILVFLTLGLLVFPSHLLQVWKEGLLLAIAMMFFSRPLSVWLASMGSSMKKNERIFVSWVGLRGAAPIILATLPWSVGVPRAEYFFNLVFFVVLLSVIVQGISIPWFAAKTRVTVPIEKEVSNQLTDDFLPEGFTVVDIDIKDNARIRDRRVVDLGLPEGVLMISLERDKRYLIPKGNTVLRTGDHVRVLARPSNLEELHKVLGETRSPKQPDLT